MPVTLTVATADQNYLNYTMFMNDVTAQDKFLAFAKIDAVDGKMTATLDVTDLNATYIFHGARKDSEGNQGQFTKTDDKVAPTTEGSITVSDYQPHSLTLNWPLATDADTPSDLLWYQVIVSDISNINHYSLAMTNGTVSKDWKTNLKSFKVDKLEDGHTYYFNVFVIDAGGNTSGYGTISAIPTDFTAPIAGSGLVISDLTQTGLTLSYGKAHDEYDAATDLQYRIVTAPTAESIDTLAEAGVVDPSQIVLDWTADRATAAVIGLNPGTQYCYAILVQDLHYNRSLYASECASTLP